MMQFISNMLSDMPFHFMRPWWLLALFVVAGLGRYLLRHTQDTGWSSVIDAALLPYLATGKQTASNRGPVIAITFALILACFALAGPAWTKIASPVFTSHDGLVILLDLSPSMLAADVTPSRLTNARLRVLDLLQARKEGYTALVAYSGDAHTVSPMTDDTHTIAAMVPSLEPGVMPAIGSNVESAVELGVQLLQNGNIQHGHMVLVTDEVSPQAKSTIVKLLEAHHYSMSVIGIGTEKGAPIPTNRGAFFTDGSGKMIMPTLNSKFLSSLAAATHGVYLDNPLDQASVAKLAQSAALLQDDYAADDTAQHQAQWADMGYWLTLPLLAFCLMAFRRGWVLGFVFCLLLPSPPAQSLEWNDLNLSNFNVSNVWQTPDQQAKKLLDSGDAKQAAELFTDPQWKGTALYEAGDYPAATEQFSANTNTNPKTTADAHYNRGNALAKAAKYDDAIKAYDDALSLQPGMQDAIDNKALVQDLKKQQEEQQQDQQQKQDEQQKKDGQQKQDDQQKSADEKKSDEQKKSDDEKKSDEQKKSDDGEKSDEQQKPDEQQKSDEQKKSDEEKKAAEQQPEEQKLPEEPAPESAQQPAQQQPATEADKQTAEQKQEMEQLMRSVPDDPGGLMREKFRYYYQQRRKEAPNQDPAQENRW